MNGLETLVLLAAAYYSGRLRQWQRNKQANEVGHHFSKAIEAMKKKGDSR